MKSIVVEPFGEVWAVRVEGAEPQLFSSGRMAEDAAKRIAKRLAASGERAELQLRLRSGATAARFVCLPPLYSEEEPMLLGGSLFTRDATIEVARTVSSA